MLQRKVTVFIIVACALAATSWQATEVRAYELNRLFTDGTVLQRDSIVPVFGTGTDGEEVTIEFRGQKQTATVKDGRWRVDLQPMEAGGPFTLIARGVRTYSVNNVMVGEVWICSGQANMQWPVINTDGAVMLIARASNPKLRLFTVDRRHAQEPLNDFTGTWASASSSSVATFSAVGYHFGKMLQEHLQVPVGIISANFGGTPAEAWTSAEALQSHVQLAGMVDQPPSVFSQESPAALFNSMIHPMIPYGIRGVVWYQGESNVRRAYQYRTLFPTLIADWRSRWGQGDFPFLFVQLAPYGTILRQPVESMWAELREAQLLTLKNVPNTAMAVITDAGDQRSENPREKEVVARRLFAAACGLAYGEDMTYSGPIYKGYKIRDDKIRLQFDNVDGGLVARDGPLMGFTICGIDREFKIAQAEIEDNEVVVWHADIAHPIAVRYGWSDYPLVNLWNEDDFPASPFRTDSFPLRTEPQETQSQ